VTLPPWSVSEVMANVETPTVQSDCILSLEDLSQQTNVVVVNALVTP